MTRTEVHKFGGTSVADASCLARVASLIAERAEESVRLVVVPSAMAGVTDRLVELGRHAVANDREQVDRRITELRARHLEVLRKVSTEVTEGVAARIESHLLALEELTHALGQLGELSLRSRDRLLSIGEKLSAPIVALALEARGLSAVALEADTFLETDDHFGEAQPLLQEGRARIRAAISPHLDQGRVTVVTGYCGCAPDGATTTLGRGGSDLSATVIAAALPADEVTIWTDVDGVATADPRVVAEAQVIPHLNYREAAEMSYYGAKVLHQRSMIPAVAMNLPVRTRNSFRPEIEGTLLDGRFTPGSHPVKAITSIHGQALVSVEGKGMAGVPGMAARVFRTLADRGISVTMISQSSSEASICFAVPAEQGDAAEMALKRELRPELARGNVEEIDVSSRIGLVAAVGLGMAHTPGIAARVFGALARRRLNILAIAQGSSELNISLALEESDIPIAVRALHEEFGLHRIDTGDDTGERFDLLLFGTGKIGRAVARLLMGRSQYIERRFGLEPRIVALADRSGFFFEPRGIANSQIESLLEGKVKGESLHSRGALPLPNPKHLVETALQYRLVHPILVDLSDADDSGEAFRFALERGCDVVSANKKPLAGDPEEFAAIQEAAAHNDRLLRAEATVGAGLPVIGTVEMLLASGDRIRSIEGCLSGTLAFLMEQLENGQRFSEAVRLAAERGYTEPDPADDLSGWDVMRKATILARWTGLLEVGASNVPEGLVGDELRGLPRNELFEELKQFDAPLAERVEDARRRECVMRYVARVEPGHLEVGPRPVPRSSPLGQLQGADNMIVIVSEHYRERPLVVRGPGAGIDVTAQGVLADILRIAAERSRGR